MTGRMAPPRGARCMIGMLVRVAVCWPDTGETEPVSGVVGVQRE
jgi:hypothetical protein